MRAKIIAPVLGITSLILILAGLLHSGRLFSAAEATAPGQRVDFGSSDSALPPTTRSPAAQTASSRTYQPQTDAVVLEEQRKENSRQRVAELAEMGAGRNPSDLAAILSELSNNDSDIRHAALGAAVDFGDRNAIPALQGAMEENRDPQEKVDIRKAINYLRLPTLTESQVSL